MRRILFFLACVFCNITLAKSILNSSTEMEVCKGKPVAILFETLLHFDRLHNCSINIVKSEKEGILRYLVEVQDDYICERYPSNCRFELLEFKIESDCANTTQYFVEDLFYQVHYEFPGGLVSKFVKAEFDYFGNLILLSMGERSLILEKNHRVTCTPTLFGGRF